MQEITHKQLFDLLGKPNPFIVDVGAYNGADSLEFAKLGATVHAFEPVNIAGFMSHPNIVLRPFAVGAVNKITVMNCSEHAQSNSVLKPKNHLEVWPDIRFDHRESVEMVRLDGFRYKPDLLWIDANGNEYDVLVGAEETLKHTRFVYVECSDRELYEGQKTSADVAELLTGFRLLGVYNHLGNFGNYLYGKL